MPAFNRRRFLATTAAGLAGTTVQAAPAVRRGGPRPTVISSGNGLTAKNGGDISCVELAFERITQGDDVLDALIAGVNIVELLCTAGLPALYTEILTMQDLPAWQNYAYLALYNVAYMFDDSLMVGLVVITLSKHKLQEKHGRWLKLISGAVIVLLGLLMICWPDLLF